MIEGKILHKDVLAMRLDEARDSGRRIVFTNGCFDILHAGHVLLLEEARSLGDLLVVGVNTDRSVGVIKGPDRPVIQETLRAVVVAALASVDYVCLFDEPTPIELIRLVKPDVLVKGQDWQDKEVVGRKEVESRGGRIILLPLVEGLSTTTILERITTLKGGRKT